MSNTKTFERQQPGSKRMIPVPISYIFVVLIFPYSKYCHLFTDIYIKKVDDQFLFKRILVAYLILLVILSALPVGEAGRGWGDH